jgi:hypothetical protein
VTDFTDRKNPEILAYSDPPPLDPNVLIPDGAWSSYWYDGYIYESDIRKGLHIFQIENPTPGIANYVPESFSNPQTQMRRIPQTIATASAVSIVHRTGPDRFGGKVTSDDAEGRCTAGRTVVIKKAQDGPDKRVGKETTDAMGGYRIAHNKGGRGTYYAVVQPSSEMDEVDTLNCARARSDSIFAQQ